MRYYIVLLSDRRMNATKFEPSNNNSNTFVLFWPAVAYTVW